MASPARNKVPGSKVLPSFLDQRPDTNCSNGFPRVPGGKGKHLYLHRWDAFGLEIVDLVVYASSLDREKLATSGNQGETQRDESVQWCHSSGRHGVVGRTFIVFHPSLRPGSAYLDVGQSQPVHDFLEKPGTSKLRLEKRHMKVWAGQGKRYTGEPRTGPDVTHGPTCRDNRRESNGVHHVALPHCARLPRTDKPAFYPYRRQQIRIEESLLGAFPEVLLSVLLCIFPGEWAQRPVSARSPCFT